jgi:hypothetical protein
LAVVDFTRNRIVLFTIALHDTDAVGTPRVELREYTVLRSDSFSQPHGVAFLGNDHLVVCNRAADVCLFRLPAVDDARREHNLRPQQLISGKGLWRPKVKTPGSVDGYATGANRYRVLVCNNHWHFISAHAMTPDGTEKTEHHGIIIQHSLKIPDGVSISHDRAWIAVSNHVDGEILIFANGPELDRHTAPVAVLKGIVCPHGVRFTPCGRVLVADAASQYLHVFESDEGRWDGTCLPARSLRLLDDETFYDGRYDSREGGLKGLDIDASGRVLVTTHQLGVLEFYDLQALLARDGVADPEQMARLGQERDKSLARQQGGVLHREWTLRSRLRQAMITARQDLKQYRRRLRMRMTLAHLDWRNRWSQQSVIQPLGPVLSMTSHADRLELVYYALESIARGVRKPARMLLWLTDPESCNHPPATLQRLRSRGLEIRHAEDLGPHTKYYPYIEREPELTVPLVTADDDMLYPRDWLELLVTAHASNTLAVHCFRAHRIGFRDGRLAPYNDWAPCEDRQPSHFNFITGVSGVIYPPAYLDYLKAQGQAFRQVCPYGDDIWLSVNALRGGFKVAQVGHKQRMFTKIPGSQRRCLFDINVLSGLNQVQLRKTYSEADLAALLDSRAMSGGNPV